MGHRSAIVRKTKTYGAKEYPLKNLWEFETDSPQKVFVAVSDAIEDTGFKVRKNPARSKRPIDSMDFDAEVVGSRRIGYLRARPVIIGIPLVIIAVILFLISVPGDISASDIVIIAVGVVLSVVGVVLCDTGIRRFKLSLIAILEGKSIEYSRGATEGYPGRMVSKTTLTIRCHVAGRRVNWADDSLEIGIMKEDFRELEKRAVSVVDSLKIE